MGLAITRGRLVSLYAEKQSLILRDVQTGGAEVRITLPYQEDTGHVESGENVALQSSDR
jgi:hypothetical protein